MLKRQLWTLLLLILVAAIPFALVGCGGTVAPPPEKDEADKLRMPFFPILHITSELDPFDIERELWHDGTIALLDAPEGIVFDAVDARIRGRGNSTWWNGPDKRPLRFRFDAPRSLMGSAYEATDWILLANHFDRSLLRNYAALYLAGRMDGLDFTPVPHHIHLYVNGAYMGVYLLTDERDVNPGRMELVWDPDPSLSDFFLELDARAPQGGTEGDTFVTVSGLHYDIRWSGSSRQRTPEHVAYAKAYLESVSAAIRSQDFAEIIALIDLDSFVDFYLVQELFKNADVHSLSVFLHITGQGAERRLFMGPVWDFDTAAGNARLQPLGYGPEYLYAAVVNYWYRYLMGVPEFFEAVTDRWNTLRDTAIAETIAHIRYTAVRYQAEFERNFERHPMHSARVPRPPAPIYEIEDFTEQVDYLIDWLETRVAWLDDFFNGRLPDHDPLWTLVTYFTYQSPIHITVHGETRHLYSPPILLHDRTMLPLQALADLFQMTLHHDPVVGTARLTRGPVTITHDIGTPHFFVDGNRVDAGIPTIVIRDQAHLPLHIVVDALGYASQWEADTRTVAITAGA